MSVIDLFDQIEKRAEKLISDGYEKDKAKKIAWEEFHSGLSKV